MKSIYLDTPTAAIALNFKVGSSSLSRAVIAAHHPTLETMLHTHPGTGQGVAYPAGKTADGTRWQSVCPKIAPSERQVVLLPVRDPVEKFRSACAESNVVDVDAKLTAIESDWGRDVHFWPQSRLLFGATKLYRFPDDLDALATEVGLTLPLPDITGGHDRPKPDLTTEQLARVEAIYADDIALSESITEAGQVYTKPAEPEPEIPASIKAHAAAASLFESLSLGKQALWEPVRAAVSEALLSGNFAKAKEILETVPNLYTGMAADKNMFLQLFPE